MKDRSFAFICALWLVALLLCWPAAAFCQGQPHLEKRGQVTQLLVDGKPFLILGGELHNSSASSLDYMQPIWPRLEQLNLNTVLATVSWELLEPEEGQFDFTLVDGLLKQARRHHLRLVLLWFGSWKNGVSSYVPAWVKKDIERFPRVEGQAGHRGEVLTPLALRSAEADARAFAALMKHLFQADGREHTVLMVQVENEVGLLGSSRDHSQRADAEFARPVPRELTEYFERHRDELIPEFKKYWEAASGKTSGTWSEVFGEGADEAFMAWHYARYIGQVVAAGKREYALPMYVNAWLVQHDGQKAGQYPSGGPVSKVLDIWRAAAPDIYLPDFQSVCASYSRSGNPLFIPEAERGPNSAAKVFYAIGQHAAIGFCPFGIDSLKPDHPLKDSYAVLDQLTPLITRYETEGKVLGLLQDKEDREMRPLAGYNLEVSYAREKDEALRGFGLVIAVAPDEFIAAGSGLGIHFSARTPGPKHTGILSIEEGSFGNGHWVPGRRLNGDENGGGWRLQLPSGPPAIQRIRLYRWD